MFFRVIIKTHEKQDSWRLVVSFEHSVKKVAIRFSHISEVKFSKFREFLESEWKRNHRTYEFVRYVNQNYLRFKIKHVFVKNRQTNVLIVRISVQLWIFIENFLSKMCLFKIDERKFVKRFEWKHVRQRTYSVPINSLNLPFSKLLGYFRWNRFTRSESFRVLFRSSFGQYGKIE